MFGYIVIKNPATTSSSLAIKFSLYLADLYIRNFWQIFFNTAEKVTSFNFLRDILCIYVMLSIVLTLDILVPRVFAATYHLYLLCDR